MKTLSLYLILTLFSTFSLLAQVDIKGVVTDQNNDPIPFANVFLKSQLIGTSTNLEGEFQFEYNKSLQDSLVIQAIGYQPKVFMVFDLNFPLNIQLEKSSTTLKTIEVYGGSSPTIEDLSAMQLNGMDIVNNASSNGDLYQTLQTMPGTSTVGDQTGLFVRGGDGTETQTIIDGTVATNPFLGNTPNMPSRGKFDPFMFEGTTFSTGGYSAEYGQALSSVLLLETSGIPEKTSTSLNLHFAGVGGSHSHVWDEKTVLMGGVTYNNLTPYMGITPQNAKWSKEPEALNVQSAFRHQTSKGMYKMYTQYNVGTVGLEIFDPSNPIEYRAFQRTGQDLYINNSYDGSLGNSWSIKAGLSINKTMANVNIGNTDYKENNQHLISKVTFGKTFKNDILLKMGSEYRNDQTLWSTIWVNDHLRVLYSEATFPITSYIKLRAGLRGEYSSNMEKFNLAPRSSLLFDIDDFNQITLSYGDFYQKPLDKFMLFDPNLDYLKSTHYIATYKRDIGGRTLRVEGYHKEYDQLIKYNEQNEFNNNGYGFARGIDFFWKDAVSLSFLEYWVTYSYIDSERNYNNFPYSATPDFVTNHNFNLIANFKIPSLRLQPGFTYSYASGRPYVNPNSDFFLADKTKDFHNLDIAINYNLNILGSFTVLFASFSNVLGFDQVFGYKYSDDGTSRVEKLPSSKQSVFLGIFMTFE